MRNIGRYVGIIEIDINVDADEPGLIPYGEFEKQFLDDSITNALQKIIQKELTSGADGTVKVTKQFGNAYQYESR
jgi:hypothetical protein